MIVQSMTDEEIIRQLETDLPEVEAKTAAKANEFRRMVIKSKSFPFNANPFTVTTANRNRWIVIFRAMDRKERKKISYAHTTFICTAAFANGIHAFINPIMITDGSREVRLIIFQPHFFARFRERLGIRKTGIDLVADYFLKNYSYYYGLQDQNTENMEWPGTRIYGTSKQGIGLGIIQSESRTLFKTFITYEMMHQAQFSIFTQNEILRQREIAQYQSSPLHHKTKQSSSIKVES